MALERLSPQAEPPPGAAESFGVVLSVSGAQANVRFKLGAPASGGERLPTVGSLLGIRTSTALAIGVITRASLEAASGQPEGARQGVASLDLLGEIRANGAGQLRFQRGITEYPRIGDAARPIDRGELKLIYDTTDQDAVHIGYLQQDHSIPAYVNVNETLSKHFAVFGTTGVGKSSGVALLLQSILDARGDVRIFLIDPHNEFGRSFGERAQVLTPRNLKLPFWLFNFEEIVDVFFRGRPGVEEEIEILSEAISGAKATFAAERNSVERSRLRKSDYKGPGYTADTPVPYRLPDLVALIDERMGRLENRSTWTKYHRLLTRIETVRHDPRYSFMFENANVGGDTMVEVLSQLFRLPAQGKPMTVMQLAGFPGEVVDSVVSVLCRMAFDFGLWSDGAVPLLFVCEEAHRYAPADRTIGFGPTRKAISRIAKEGRKYGVYLALITQRPAELDATIISQCSTLFAMRMANDRDQAIVRAAVSDAAASLLGFVPSLGTREVFAFGEGVALPTRLHFKELPAHLVPRSEAIGGEQLGLGRELDEQFIASVVERWRGATMSRNKFEEGAEDFEALGSLEYSRLEPSYADADCAAEPRSLRSFPTGSAATAFEFRQEASPPSSPSGPTQAFPAGLHDLRQRLKTRGGF